ncbi:hypothetical protein BD289DRAFT_443907 [Coniella lustricola]|uniref:Uncharacterized protein n=1 Tax=Coniella lustricola TaxID=2025994 RepID=A0A2T2ZWK1_9PEZI|nr:hypothetical protein BD289DRAFT_443907 [Coniella lustricola]
MYQSSPDQWKYIKECNLLHGPTKRDSSNAITTYEPQINSRLSPNPKHNANINNAHFHHNTLLFFPHRYSQQVSVQITSIYSPVYRDTGSAAAAAAAAAGAAATVDDAAPPPAASPPGKPAKSPLRGSAAVPVGEAVLPAFWPAPAAVEVWLHVLVGW